LLNIAAFLVISLVYLWTFYNLPILLVGVRSLRREKKRQVSVEGELPFISIIVPVKNEARVVGRLLSALEGLDYPRDRREFIVVEDGSEDGSLEICERFSSEHGDVRVVCSACSYGKPSALMEALPFVRGEIVGVFDADSVPEADALLRVAEYFSDSKISALQGRVCAINRGENMLTRFVAQEEAVRYDGFMRGKEELGLFVPLNGSCYFVRKDVLDSVGGWNVDALSEDMELAAHLVHAHHKIRYASDVRSWQEYPSSVGGFFRQRVRWFRGTMEASLRYGKLLRHPNGLSFDAEVTMAGPFVFLSFVMGYIIPVLALVWPYQVDFGSLLLANFTTVLTFVLLGLAGGVMVYANKPRRLRSVLWVPFIFSYWFVQNFIAAYALLLMVFRRPRNWNKTKKTGFVEK
jgi:cellulose synthase/poly-beta-1,6-N-acetylglucosamine synthase-like glycosyltransferase